VALAVFTVSLVGPASAVSPASKVALVFLHLIVDAILIPGLRRSTAQPRATVGLDGRAVPLGVATPTS